MEKVKENYESPEFKFQELQVLEKIADKCWGCKYVFVDHDDNDATGPITYYITEQGCEGEKEEDVQKRLAALKAAFPDIAAKVTEADVKVNVSGSSFVSPPGKSI